VYEDAARERAREANHLAKGGYMSGALYLAGYVVECRLKALLQKMGKSFPAAGPSGHNLIGLWDAAGLRHQDLTGFCRAFIDYWNTSLRYSATVSSEHAPEDLLDGGHELAARVHRRTTNVRGAVRGRRQR
jgi:HEPN domain-containing protein